MFNVNLPMEVVVLNCWVTETKDTPCWSNSSTQLAAQLTTSPPPFDLSQDFAPDGLVADASEVIAISSKVRANNLQMLARALNIKMVHVPFRGSMEGMREMAAGNVQMSIATQPSIAPFMDSNSLIRIIAVAGPKRLSSLPNVPTTGRVRVPGG